MMKPSDIPNWRIKRTLLEKRNKDFPEEEADTERKGLKEEELGSEQEQDKSDLPTLIVTQATTQKPNNKIVTITDQDNILSTLLTIDVGEIVVGEVWIAKMNVAKELAIKEAEKKPERTLEEMVPKELWEFKDVFDKQKAERFPELQPWDHMIDLKEDFVLKDCKIYPLSLPEQQELDKFIDKNLAKEYIRPSKSPMASPFFFIDKKDGKL